MEGMTFDRGTLTFTLMIEGAHWVVKSRNPNYDGEATSSSSFEEEIMRTFGMGPKEQPEFHTQALHPDQVLALLTPEECRLLLGYCSHICEHGTKHLDELAEALTVATTARNWDTTKVLMMDMTDAIVAVSLAKDTARTIIELPSGVVA